MADDYAQRFANDAMKGHTVRLQMQIKVSDFGQIEMICQYIQFDLGMNIVLDNCPEFAKKDACSCVVDKQKNNNTTQKATKEKEVVKKEKSIENTAPVEEVPFVDATTSKQSDENQSEEVNDDFVLELTQLSQNIPIIVCETTKEYINGVIKNKASQKPSSNNPNSRDSEDYAVFRSLMKNI
jgi:small nuclear ribonucleoprotein (snRNP)-like protein